MSGRVTAMGRPFRQATTLNAQCCVRSNGGREPILPDAAAYTNDRFRRATKNKTKSKAVLLRDCDTGFLFLPTHRRQRQNDLLGASALVMDYCLNCVDHYKTQRHRLKLHFVLYTLTIPYNIF